MDSMRSLNTSLPQSASSSTRRHNPHAHPPSTELLQAFKAAALSVTQLYKTASAASDASTSEAHAAGYRDALEDLLEFLDQRNLGLGDGEGWTVRQWATQRHGSMPTGNAHADGSDDLDIPAAAAPATTTTADDDKRARSSSPVMQHKSSPAHAPPRDRDTVARADSSPPVHADAQDHDRHAPAPSRPDTDMFHFRSPVSLPVPHDTEMTNHDRSSSPSSPPLLRVDVLPPGRSARPPGNRHARGDRGGTGNLNSLGHGAGSKRKMALTEFFDISGLGAGYRDGFGGGKKGKFA